MHADKEVGRGIQGAEDAIVQIDEFVLRANLDHFRPKGLQRPPQMGSSDEEVVLLPSLGGSLPLYLFEEMLETPVIIVPIANHDDNQHAPDENLRLANLWYGIDLMGEILTMP